MKASCTHICDLHNHYGAYICRCRTFWVRTCACVCWSSSSQPLPKWDPSSVPAWFYCLHGLYYEDPPTTSFPQSSWIKYTWWCAKKCAFFLFYARVARFYLSPITSPVHVQWSPAVSAGCKHSKETQGSNCPCQVTGELPLLLWFHWLEWFAC